MSHSDHLASSDTAATLSGHFIKHAGNIGTSHKRFFIFLPRLQRIQYFVEAGHDHKGKDLKGEIILTKETKASVVGKDMLVIDVNKRKYQLKASADANPVVWMNQLKSYISHMSTTGDDHADPTTNIGGDDNDEDHDSSQSTMASARSGTSKCTIWIDLYEIHHQASWSPGTWCIINLQHNVTFQ